MIEVRQIFLFIHILFAIIWVGGILFVGWGIFPALRKFSYENQRVVLLAIMTHAHLWLTLIGIIVIVTGYLLGTILGPLSSFNQMIETPYGHKFLTALTIGILALL